MFGLICLSRSSGRDNSRSSSGTNHDTTPTSATAARANSSPTGPTQFSPCTTGRIGSPAYDAQRQPAVEARRDQQQGRRLARVRARAALAVGRRLRLAVLGRSFLRRTLLGAFDTRDALSASSAGAALWLCQSRRMPGMKNAILQLTTPGLTVLRAAGQLWRGGSRARVSRRAASALAERSTRPDPMFMQRAKVRRKHYGNSFIPALASGSIRAPSGARNFHDDQQS